MQTRRSIQRAVAAVLAALATTVAACSGSTSDKAGGPDEAEARVLTLANPNDGGPPAQVDSWAEQVARLSGGTLAIEFENGWRLGEPLYEAGTLEDVQAGKVDMAWVGSRVFDTVGVSSFQALGAPLLVDSYDLEGRVFEEGIPEQMLDGVSELDLVGIGVLPGQMRKVLGVSEPFVRPADFEGQVVGVQDSAVANASLRALGAEPRPVPSAAELDGLDAYEQQLGSIWGNSYETGADYVTANVNLWPRPLVIVMSNEAFESLADEQQSALRGAAAAAMPEALAAARAEDEEAAPVLCRRGMTFAVASESDLSQLRQAFEPVYADLDADPETKSHIDAIAALKTEIAAPAEAPVCDSEGGKPASAVFLEGRYESTITEDDWQGSEGATGTFTMEFDSGDVTVYQPETGEVGFRGTYTVFRDRFEMTGGQDTVSARWSSDGKRLTFTDIAVCTASSCAPSEDTNPFVVVMGSHPWLRVEPEPSSIDGVYRTTVTREALEQSPLLYDSGEVNDQNWGELTLTFEQGRVMFEQENDVTSSSTSGTYEVDGDTVVLDFTEGVNAGETFAVRWSLFRDKLTFTRDEALGIIPTPYLIEPWNQVE